MRTPDNPIDLALRLVAQGKDEAAFVIAQRHGIGWSVLMAEKARRAAADLALWTKSKGRAA